MFSVQQPITRPTTCVGAGNSNGGERHEQKLHLMAFMQNMNLGIAVAGDAYNRKLRRTLSYNVSHGINVLACFTVAILLLLQLTEGLRSAKNKMTRVGKTAYFEWKSVQGIFSSLKVALAWLLSSLFCRFLTTISRYSASVWHLNFNNIFGFWALVLPPSKTPFLGTVTPSLSTTTTPTCTSAIQRLPSLTSKGKKTRQRTTLEGDIKDTLDFLHNGWNFRALVCKL